VSTKKIQAPVVDLVLVWQDPAQGGAWYAGLQFNVPIAAAKMMTRGSKVLVYKRLGYFLAIALADDILTIDPSPALANHIASLTGWLIDDMQFLGLDAWESVK